MAAKSGHSLPLSQRARGAIEPAPGIENCEYACGVLFMTIFPPYFLVYDQALLAVPLVMLWSSPAWRWGIALFATATALAADSLLRARFQPHRTRGPGDDARACQDRAENCDLEFMHR